MSLAVSAKWISIPRRGNELYNFHPHPRVPVQAVQILFLFQPITHRTLERGLGSRVIAKQFPFHLFQYWQTQLQNECTRCCFTASLIHWPLGDSSSLKVIKPDHQKKSFWTGFGFCWAAWLQPFIFLEIVVFDSALQNESASCLPGLVNPLRVNALNHFF